MKKIFLLFVTAFVFLLQGCSEKEDQDFIGEWAAFDSKGNVTDKLSIGRMKADDQADFQGFFSSINISGVITIKETGYAYAQALFEEVIEVSSGFSSPSLVNATMEYNIVVHKLNSNLIEVEISIALQKINGLLLDGNYQFLDELVKMHRLNP